MLDAHKILYNFYAVVLNRSAKPRKRESLKFLCSGYWTGVAGNVFTRAVVTPLMVVCTVVLEVEAVWRFDVSCFWDGLVSQSVFGPLNLLVSDIHLNSRQTANPTPLRFLQFP